MHIYNSTVQEIHFPLTSSLLPQKTPTNSKGISQLDLRKGIEEVPRVVLLWLRASPQPSLVGGLGGVGTHCSKCSRGCLPLHQSSKRKYLCVKLAWTIDPLKEKVPWVKLCLDALIETCGLVNHSHSQGQGGQEEWGHLCQKRQGIILQDDPFSSQLLPPHVLHLIKRM